MNTATLFIRYASGALIIAAFFWMSTVFWLLSTTVHPSTAKLGLLTIVLCAYFAALACAYLFPAQPHQGARRHFIAFGVGSSAFLCWLAGGIMLGKLVFPK